MSSVFLSNSIICILKNLSYLVLIHPFIDQNSNNGHICFASGNVRAIVAIENQRLDLVWYGKVVNVYEFQMPGPMG